MTCSSDNVLDGKRSRWSDLLTLRRKRYAATAQAKPLALCTDLHDDSRPQQQRTASRRSQQPILLTQLEHREEGTRLGDHVHHNIPDEYVCRHCET